MNTLIKIIKVLLMLCYFSAPIALANAQGTTQTTARENKTEQEPKRTEEVSLNQLQARSIIKGWDYFLKNVASKAPDSQIDPLHYSMRLYRKLDVSESIDYIVFIDKDGARTEGVFMTRNLRETPDTIVNGDQLKALLVAWSNFTKIKVSSHDAADYSFYIYREEDFIYVDIQPRMPELYWSTTDTETAQHKTDGASGYIDRSYVYKLKHKDYSVVEIGVAGA